MREEEIYIDDGYPYPLTVIKDRYSGVYSGAKFLAFNLHAYEVPEEVEGDDVSCGNFFSNPFIRKEHGRKAEQFWIGKGETPNEAIKDLLLADKR